jgi:hypothetical protein
MISLLISLHEIIGIVHCGAQGQITDVMIKLLKVLFYIEEITMTIENSQTWSQCVSDLLISAFLSIGFWTKLLKFDSTKTNMCNIELLTVNYSCHENQLH